MMALILQWFWAIRFTVAGTTVDTSKTAASVLQESPWAGVVAQIISPPVFQTNSQRTDRDFSH
jgi:hypothetical protein